MEHRHYQRRTLNLSLRLFVNGRLANVAHSIEISPAGACIYDPGLGLKNNQIVAVDVCGQNHSHFTQALVIHNNGGRVGLMFADIIPLQRLVSRPA